MQTNTFFHNAGTQTEAIVCDALGRKRLHVSVDIQSDLAGATRDSGADSGLLRASPASSAPSSADCTPAVLKFHELVAAIDHLAVQITMFTNTAADCRGEASCLPDAECVNNLCSSSSAMSHRVEASEPHQFVAESDSFREMLSANAKVGTAAVERLCFAEVLKANAEIHARFAKKLAVPGL